MSRKTRSQRTYPTNDIKGERKQTKTDSTHATNDEKQKQLAPSSPVPREGNVPWVCLFLCVSICMFPPFRTSTEWN